MPSVQVLCMGLGYITKANRKGIELETVGFWTNQQLHNRSEPREFAGKGQLHRCFLCSSLSWLCECGWLLQAPMWGKIAMAEIPLATDSSGMGCSLCCQQHGEMHSVASRFQLTRLYVLFPILLKTVFIGWERVTCYGLSAWKQWYKQLPRSFFYNSPIWKPKTMLKDRIQRRQAWDHDGDEQKTAINEGLVGRQWQWSVDS